LVVFAFSIARILRYCCGRFVVCVMNSRIAEMLYLTQTAQGVKSLDSGEFRAMIRSKASDFLNLGESAP
jgi:hypothetical protein